jgi:DNA polymerase III delta prime subunit
MIHDTSVLQLSPLTLLPTRKSMACTSTLPAGSGSGSMNQEQPKPRTKLVNRWVCDVCKVAVFPTLEEACLHEEACGMQQQVQEAPTLPAPSPSPPTSQEPLEEPPEPQATKNPAKVVSPQAPNSFFKPKKATVVRKDISKPATKRSANPFFQPKSVPANKKEACEPPPECITINDEPTKTATATPSLPNKSKTASSTSSTASRKRISSTRKKQDAVIDVDQQDTATMSQTAASLASVIDLELDEETTKRAKFTGMFATNNKALLAEQRQVEFQAKRRMERQRELERQQKRAATTTRQVQLPVPAVAAATSTTKPTTTRPLATSSLPKTATKPNKRPPAAAKKLSLPLAPRFPVPSHVIPPDDSMEVDPTHRWLDASRITESRRSLTTDASTPQEMFNTTFRLLSPTEENALSCSDDSRDLFREAFQNLLQPPKSLSDDARLWSEKYGMDGLVGTHSQQALQRLLKWVDEWRKARSQAMDRMAERHRKLGSGQRRKGKRKTKKNADLWSDDSDDEFELCNVCLVTGPTGSGKSGLVHTVAKQSHCQVLELNTTDARGGAALKHRIQEATQSCSSLDMLKSQTNVFTATATGTPSSQEPSDSDDDEGEPEAARSSLTVILIDEVDILFENYGDNGFWSALTSLAKTAKCPIFLTANTVPSQIMSIKHDHVTTARPTPEECASKIWQVAKQEQFSTLEGVEGDTIKERLAWMAQVLECDLRRLLQELQFFAHDRSDPHAWNKHTIQEEEESMDWTSSIPKISRPKLDSIEPVTVSSDKYSIITLKGENFQALANLCPTQGGEFSLQVRVASQVCPKICLVDDKTILALCPPCAVPSTVDPLTCRSYIHHRESLDTRVAPVSVHSKHFRLGILTSCDNTIETSQLVDGQALSSLSRPVVDYYFASKDDEESEFAPDKTVANNGDQNVLPMKLLEEGLVLWDTTLGKLKDKLPASHEKPEAVKVNDSDKKMQEELERLSANMQFGSDAALLEDMQYGIPLLSGACRGFGFDLTDDEDLTEGKLRMHENTKPYVLICYFYECRFLSLSLTFAFPLLSVQVKNGYMNWDGNKIPTSLATTKPT